MITENKSNPLISETPDSSSSFSGAVTGQEWTGKTLESLLQDAKTWPEAWQALKKLHNSSLAIVEQRAQEAEDEQRRIAGKWVEADARAREAESRKANVRRVCEALLAKLFRDGLIVDHSDEKELIKEILSENSNVSGSPPGSPKLPSSLEAEEQRLKKKEIHG